MNNLFLNKLKTLRILYVEDEEGIRKKISDALRYYSKEVFEATDGESGLKLYKEKNPDIIFTDILMPKMNGIEFIKQVRQSDDQIPIVITTAHTDMHYLLSAIELHLEQYIIKPINLKDLKKSLQKCIETILKVRSVTEILPCGFCYDFDNKILTREGEEIKLNKKEILFFELLIQNKHRVVSYQEIQDYVWQDDIMSDDALKSLVRNIRQKFPKGCIKNLSGVGYRILND
ncbi:response regulator transcription factor [Sulfurospirillum sp. 1612]|uniref:response regulator transcription factor n=1 Tax=Sulfurospirillum sp. 1612 TaxID=3094835 RepID=UPI002F93866C